MKPENVQSSAEAARQRRIALALVGLIAAVMIGLGVLAIVTGVSAGTSRQGKLVVTEGDAGRWIGASEISFGVMVLGAAVRNPRHRLWWLLLWAVLALVCIAMAVARK